MLTLSQEERQTIIKVHSMPEDINQSQIRKVFQNFFLVAMIDYMQGEKTYLPYFGHLQIDYEGDEISDGMREAKIIMTVDPTDFIKRIVGDIEEENIDSILEGKLFRDIGNVFEEEINR